MKPIWVRLDVNTQTIKMISKYKLNQIADISQAVNQNEFIKIPVCVLISTMLVTGFRP